MSLQTEPNSSPVRNEPKTTPMAPSPPHHAAPAPGRASTHQAPSQSQQPEPSLPEVNSVPAESAEMLAIKVQLATFQAEAAQREEAARNEDAEKVVQQAKINVLTKASADKRRRELALPLIYRDFSYSGEEEALSSTSMYLPKPVHVLTG